MTRSLAMPCSSAKALWSVSGLLLLVAVVATATGAPARPDGQASAGGSKAQSDPVVLVQEGVARLPILVGSFEKPARELEHYLERMSGADLRVSEAKPGRAGVYVGTASEFPWLELGDLRDLGAEGFVLRSDGRSVFLVGRESPSVQHAVTTFLHRVGCRWFFPGTVWEIIPRRKTVAGSWNERQAPSFPMQRSIWYGYGAYRQGREELDDWNRHNRMGGPIAVRIGHTWHGLDPEKDFKKNPEWFALAGGRRQPSKPCYSHPQVLERAVAFALGQASRREAMISMSPPDGLGYCECDRCRAVFQGGRPFEAHRTYFARRPDGVLVNLTSETLFSFVNRVAEAVAKNFPECRIGCYAYSAYSHPPSFDLHPNVYLQTTASFRRTPLTLEEQINAFGKRTKDLGVREYYSVYQWDWDYPDPGKVAPGRLQKDLRFYQREGVTAINAEASNNWAPRGLGYYVASQLLWNVDGDVKAIIRDFYEKAFGPAARPIERYYVRWYGPEAAALDDSAKLPQKSAYSTNGDLDVDALRAAYRDLDVAARLVGDLPAHRDRVDRLRMYVHYLVLRYRLLQAKRSGEKERILQAIRDETVFGGRLTNTNMVHGRALIGKAFLRRFRDFAPLLKDVPEASEPGRGWRQVGEPPSRDELERLWEEDRATLAIE